MIKNTQNIKERFGIFQMVDVILGFKLVLYIAVIVEKLHRTIHIRENAEKLVFIKVEREKGKVQL